jgi:uncharacterized protein (DUF934 family)
MSVLVTAAGLGREDAAPEFRDLETLLAGTEALGGLAVDLPNDRDAAELAPYFGDLALIRVTFPAMGDGRGFSLARRLRDLGYRGRLRAFGPLVPDQVRAAFRVGFDEIELPAEHAARSPEARWHPAGQGSYQDRLAG